MSVINKMLKDLDDRGGLGPRSLEEGIRDVERVRPQPQVREERRWGVISASVILAVAAIGVGWYLLKPGSPPPAVAKQAVPVAPKTPAPSAPAPAAPAPAPVVASAPVVATPPAPVQAPAPAPQPAVTAETRPAPPPEPKPAPELKPVPVAPSPEPAKPTGQLALIGDAQMAKAAADKSVAKTEAAVAAAREAIPGRAPATSPPPVATVQVPQRPKAEPAPIVAAVPPQPAKADPAPAPRKEAEAAEARPAPQGKVSVDRGDRTLTGPARAVAEYRTASDMLAQGRVPAALEGYATALRHDPRHVPARQALAVLLLDNGRAAEAQGVLREGIEAVPSNTSWPMLLARLQVEGGDVKSALETLERSLPQARGQPEYHAFVATLMQMQGRHADAIQQYDVALRASPDSARSLAGLAISLEAEKRIPEAREAYRRALAAGGLGRDLEAFAERKLKQLQ